MQQGGLADGEQRCRPAAVPSGHGPGRPDKIRGAGHLAMEIAGIKRSAPDGFVDPAQLGDGELGSTEGRGEGGVLELRPGAFDTVGQDPTVVERQGGHPVEDLLDGVQGCGGGV